MFPLEREGIQQAVNVLRGQQYMIGETPMISTMAIDQHSAVCRFFSNDVGRMVRLPCTWRIMLRCQWR
jgi:hypothetical protein